MIFAVKTVVGRENIVADTVATKARSSAMNVQSLMHPEEIKGYVFIEGDIKDIEKVVQMVPHVRGLIKSPINISEIQRFLQPKEVVIDFDKGDVVEIIGGPFKGERGKITRHDKMKREVVIELLEAAIPIPVTVSVEFIKLVEKVK